MSYVGKVIASGTTHLVGSTLYGTCTTAAATAQKDVTCSDFDELITGATIHVKFTYSNTAATPTLKVGSTAAKNIYKYGTTKPGTTAATSWQAGSVISFTYDGSYWQMNDHLDDTNTNNAVTQTATNTTDANYEVLFSNTADNTTRTEGARKSEYLVFNPNKMSLIAGTLRSDTTLGVYSSAFGHNTEVSGDYSFAVGENARASGDYSFAAGYNAKAYGDCSFAFVNAEASGYGSIALGQGTIAVGGNQIVTGEYNVADTIQSGTSHGKYIEIVGNGVVNDPSNARTLDWNGNEVLAGKLTVGAAPTNNMDVATKQYVDTKNFAGSSSAGGAATSAAKLTNTSKIGDTNKPVYFTASGVPAAISYTIGKSVPSDAVFTDTTYTIATGDSNGQIKVTPSSGSAYNVSVKGLGSNAYTSTAYLPLTGGALSGDLSILNWAEPKNNDITIGTTSNNGVSSGTKSSGARWTDSNDFWYGAAYGTCNSSGQSIAHLASRNMKTNGDVVTSDFQVITNKDGTTSYHVGNPSAFQTAINNCSFKNWMDANETQSNIPGTNGCGFIIGANTRVSFYNVTGSAGSYALSVNSITSANITDWFTITCNATTGLLTVKNKSTSAHYLTIIGCC